MIDKNEMERMEQIKIVNSLQRRECIERENMKEK